jgi:hypothetical protein
MSPTHGIRPVDPLLTPAIDPPSRLWRVETPPDDTGPTPVHRPVGFRDRPLITSSRSGEYRIRTPSLGQGHRCQVIFRSRPKYDLTPSCLLDSELPPNTELRCLRDPFCRCRRGVHRAGPAVRTRPQGADLTEGAKGQRAADQAFAELCPGRTAAPRGGEFSGGGHCQGAQ